MWRIPTTNYFAHADPFPKLNYKKIADMFGEGATYDAIEGRFRIIKREAQKLKGEIDEGRREPAPNRGGKAQVTPRKPRTPQTNRVFDHDGKPPKFQEISVQ